MLLLFFAACFQTPDSGKQDTGPDVRRDSADSGEGDTAGSGDTADSGDGETADSGDTGTDTGDGDTGTDTGDTGDTGKDTGDTGKDTADTGKDTADTGDTGKDSGDTGDTGEDTADSGDTGKDSGDSGDTGKDTADTGTDTGDTGDTGTDTADSGDTAGDDARLGLAYAITMSDGTITEPAAAATLLEGEYDRGAMLFEVQAIADSTFTLLGAWSTSGSRPPTQETTLSTWWWSADFSGDPTFTTTPTDCVIGLGGVDEDWYEVELSGELPADGGDLADAALTGLLDTHNLDTLYGGDGSVCTLIGLYGVSCEACPDGRDRCVRLTIEGLSGAAQSTLDLVEVP